MQLSLFDEKNLVEIQSAQYPGERLMACYNPLLAEERKRKREDLLQSTEKSLTRIVKEAERRKHKPLSATEIHAGAGETLEVVLSDRLHLGGGRPHATQLRAHAKAGGGLAEE